MNLASLNALLLKERENFSKTVSSCSTQVSPPVTHAAPTFRRVEKFKNLRRNIFRAGKYVYVLGRLKKVV